MEPESCEAADQCMDCCGKFTPKEAKITSWIAIARKKEFYDLPLPGMDDK